MRSAIFYILLVLSANLTATLFIPLPFFGIVAIGTFIFGFTFTQRDYMHRHGRPFVYKVIVIAAVLNLAVLLAFKHLFGPALVEALQFSGYSWLYEGFNTLLGNTYRVFIASFIAIILAETADTEVYHRLRHRSWLTRVLGSNAISIPVDTVLFYCIAFVGVANWSLEMLGAAIFGEIIIKYVIGFAYGLTGEGIRSKSDSLDMDKALS